MSKKYSKYDDAFRKKAVAYMNENGPSKFEKEFKVASSLVYKWRKDGVAGDVAAGKRIGQNGAKPAMLLDKDAIIYLRHARSGMPSQTAKLEKHHLLTLLALYTLEDKKGG